MRATNVTASSAKALRQPDFFFIESLWIEYDDRVKLVEIEPTDTSQLAFPRITIKTQTLVTHLFAATDQKKTMVRFEFSQYSFHFKQLTIRLHQRLCF